MKLPKRIPLMALDNMAARHRDAVLAAMQRVLDGGWYILGQEVEAFEREWAAYLGTASCIGVGNGTDAIAVALRAVGVQSGDEVLTVSHTAVATVAAIEQIGAVPVLVDIDPRSRCLDPARVADLCTDRTRAMVPVHMYGQPAPMPALLSIAKQYGLRVVEDCAQAHGAEIDGRKVGTFGDAAAFSFYPTKNLGAFGDAGAVVTGSAEVATAARALRQYGWATRYVSDRPGINSRLDELHAACLRVLLPQLDADNRRRRDIAAAYHTAVRDCGVRVPARIDGTTPVVHLYVVECAERERFEAHMSQRGIDTGRHYPMAVHEQPAYCGRLRGHDRLPNTERLYRELVTLPCHPGLTDEEVRCICDALAEWNPSLSTGDATRRAAA
ncbi:MAG: DegT/DnrJ/EryC1/StrS family aminotransferase [Nitrospiraceae bacterium]